MTEANTYRLFKTAAIAVAALICSCSNDGPESLTEMPMQILTDLDQSSRATVALNGNTHSIWASAIHNYDGAYTSYFQNLKLDYNSESNKYIATNYFYPLTGSMDFVAYASNGSANPTVSISKTASAFTSMLVDLTSSDGTYEVIYSDVSTISCPPSTPATLHFHRPMANLRFIFTPADNLTCSHVTINSITVKDVTYKCKYKVTYNGTNSSFGWVQKSTQGDCVLNVPASSVMGWDSTNKQPVPMEIGDGLHIVPREGRTQIIINYTMHNDPSTISNGGVGGGLSSSDNYQRNLYYVIGADAGNNWETGTQYFYNIKVYGNQRMDVTNIDVLKAVHDPTGTMNI